MNFIQKYRAVLALAHMQACVLVKFDCQLVATSRYFARPPSSVQGLSGFDSILLDGCKWFVPCCVLGMLSLTKARTGSYMRRCAVLADFRGISSVPCAIFIETGRLQGGQWVEIAKNATCGLLMLFTASGATS